MPIISRKKKRIEHNKIINGVINASDRLSSLPDAVLAVILSLLPIKSAAATALLSWRWRRFWTQLTSLRHDGCSLPDFFTVAVDQILPKLTSSVMHAFEFHGANPRPPHTDKYLRLISLICKRHVKKIDISFNVLDGCRRTPLPSCVFECESLEILILDEGFDLKVPNGGIRVPNLRDLNVYVCDGNVDFMVDVFKSCPKLERLLVNGDFHSYGQEVHIKCLTLKWLKLILRHRNNDQFGPKIVINAPNLELLDVGGYHMLSCTFEQAPASLIDAKIQTRMNWGFGNGLNLIQSIDNVKWLTLDGDIFEALGSAIIIPTFSGLTTLTGIIRSFTCWEGLIHLLGQCPSLQGLVVIRGGIGRWDELTCSGLCWPPSCLMTTVKRIRLKCLLADADELKLISSILGIAKVLETLEVEVASSSRVIKEVKLYQEFDFCMKLRKFQRSCSPFQIKFSGQYYDFIGRH